MDFDRKTLTLMQATAERYHANMTGEALDYLEGRGITQATCSRYLLGVCDDIHQGRLAIPYLRPSGVVWINHRSLDGTPPKYIAHGSKHLYNTIDLDVADQTGEIAIAEGELDTITASSLYGVPCVGIPGATQYSGNRHWRELFTGYQRIWVLADPDQAGMGLATAILESLPAARLVKLPSDVNECWNAGVDIKEFMK